MKIFASKTVVSKAIDAHLEKFPAGEFTNCCKLKWIKPVISCLEVLTGTTRPLFQKLGKRYNHYVQPITIKKEKGGGGGMGILFQNAIKRKNSVGPYPA